MAYNNVAHDAGNAVLSVLPAITSYKRPGTTLDFLAYPPESGL